MRTVGHDPNAFREPLGFVDLFALLTLASAVGVMLVMVVTVVVSLLS
jgi:hypothetical protein